MDNNCDLAIGDDTIKDEHTLLEVAATLVALLEIQPVNAARFVTDWLAEWAQMGESQCCTVAQIDRDAFWRQTLGFMSRSVEYLTTEQQAWFVRQNLPNVVAGDRFQRCISALVEHSTSQESAKLLEKEGEAAALLTSDELMGILGDLAGPISTANAVPW